MINVELIPTVSVGPFKFGKQINTYLQYDHSFFKKDIGDKYMEDYYLFYPIPLIVFVNKSGQITTINCKETCYWKGENLFNLSKKEVFDLTNQIPYNHEKIFLMVDEITGQEQDVYTFEELGLQIWFWHDVIQTVSCTDYHFNCQTH